MEKPVKGTTKITLEDARVYTRKYLSGLDDIATWVPMLMDALLNEIDRLNRENDQLKNKLNRADSKSFTMPVA